jgi:hypothetical protein
MPTILDPCSTIATAVKTLLVSDAVLAAYGWQEWESDAAIALPRGYVNVAMVTELVRAEPGVQKWDIQLVFEGKPKKGSPANAVAEVLGQCKRPDLGAALQALITDGSVTFSGGTEALRYTQTLRGDLRVRTISLSLFGTWNVIYTP